MLEWFSNLDSVWKYCIAGVGIIAVLALAIWVVDAIRQMVFRSKFHEQYGVNLPHSVRIKRYHHEDDPIGTLVLRFPYWSAAKRDGTRDQRTKNTTICYQKSLIDIGPWGLSDKNPLVMYRIALDLRAQGHAVGYCQEEKIKRQSVMEQVNAQRSATSVANIVAQFRSQPTDFEPFCADVFRNLGWSAEVTPPVRDGGFDLKLYDPQGVSFIAECKCYEPKHRVGRPIIQKLQGANTTVGAQGMMVITTSGFSRDAVTYANQVGVQLIDGDMLVRLCAQAFGESDAQPVPASAFALTRNDIMQYIPADMWNMF